MSIGKRKVKEAETLLRAFGLAGASANSTAAYVLLALAQILPKSDWADAKSPMLGIRAIMDFRRNQYKCPIAENSRETIRRVVLHEWLRIGLVLYNPDDPARPTNSSKACYQLAMPVVEALRAFKTGNFEIHLSGIKEELQAITDTSREALQAAMIPVRLPDGGETSLHSGGQNTLIKAIVEACLPRFAPESLVAYLGGAESGNGLVDLELLKKLGVGYDVHQQFPDVVAYFPERQWVLVCEAVTTHGPIHALRHEQLRKIFDDTKHGIVFITCFETRRAFAKYAAEISWETEVWIAENPDHMIHFNGQRFLGPYSPS